MVISPFKQAGDGVNIVGNAASQALLLPVIDSGFSGSRSLRLYNKGAAEAFVKLGIGTDTTTAALGMPLLPNAVIIIEWNMQTHLIVFAAGTQTIYATPGFHGV